MCQYFRDILHIFYMYVIGQYTTWRNYNTGSTDSNRPTVCKMLRYLTLADNTRFITFEKFFHALLTFLTCLIGWMVGVEFNAPLETI